MSIEWKVFCQFIFLIMWPIKSYLALSLRFFLNYAKLLPDTLLRLFTSQKQILDANFLEVKYLHYLYPTKHMNLHYGEFLYSSIEIKHAKVDINIIIIETFWAWGDLFIRYNLNKFFLLCLSCMLNALSAMLNKNNTIFSQYDSKHVIGNLLFGGSCLNYPESCLVYRIKLLRQMKVGRDCDDWHN